MFDLDSKLIAQIFGDCEGPLGFRMKSPAAKELETLMKDLPEDCKKAGLKHAVFIPEGTLMGKAGEKDDRTDTSIITTDSIDRDREVMLPEGGNFKQFLKNPVVTWCHQYNVMPVGKCMWMKRVEEEGKNGWVGKTYYTPAPANWKSDWFPDAVWHMVQEKVLRGKSIGFLPMKMRLPTEKEIGARPELAKMPVIIEKWMAVEYAACPVQCNPDAVVETVGKCKQKGIALPERFLADIGIEIPEDTPALDLKALGLIEDPEAPPIPTNIPFRTFDQAVKSIAEDPDAVLRRVFRR